jgi:pimeloyl-ACP methyl ester carboxylesterase
MVRMPANRSRLHSILRQSGHGPSVDDGRIPDEFVDWRLSVERETDSMRHERDMVCAIVKGKSYRPGLTFDDAELAAIRQPTLHVHGTSDETVGSVESWKRLAEVLPRGELHLVDGAGHMPWFDNPQRVAREVREFLGNEPRA